MNNIDPAEHFSSRPGHRLKQDAGNPAVLNEMARHAAAQLGTQTLSPAAVQTVLRLIEFIILIVSGLVAYRTLSGPFNIVDWHYYIAFTVGPAIAITFLEFSNCYQIAALMRPFTTFSNTLLVWASTFALMALAAFMLKVGEDFSRLMFGLWFVGGFASSFILRLIVAHLIRRWARNGRMERRAVIVGGGKSAESLIRAIEQQPFNDIRICGIFDDRDDKRSPPLVAGYPKLGTISELIEFARIAHIDMLLVSLPVTAEQRVLQLLKKLWVLPVDIRLSAQSSALQFRPRAYSYIGSVPLLDIFDKPIDGWSSIAKRIFDITFSLIGILAFSPIMIATAIAIKLDSKGPVLFKQKRHGFNNEVIEVYKFRSMYADQSDPTAKKTVTRNDPRVTRVGRFIRKTSIDELPQFFNALFGSLSLVGPRPHAVAAQSHNLLYAEVVDGYFARHKVKPGVTGWAQINGWRGEMDTDEKIRMRTELDLYYIENWSLLFDLRILFLTPIRLLNTENAY
ncbi:undecaprenyl-phosphate glucose phosphotransferase [Aquamicrobium segne]|uniref:Undecaprenyl-phosphate glucose phosphotransferase n=1 Tax=Aquamicrobium segne TaxID=469547 RepID=A0ABW0H168_9HYPH